ncbi:MAG: Hint domain-containing protein [Nanoarchaeota archaeon]|nr:Hint domain-containing protein [Nanoarchaeota archaeon]
MAFDPETMITMADGQFVAAGDIEKGDEVIALDTDARQAAAAKVLEADVFPAEKAVLVRMHEEITCSEGQLFIMKDFSTKKAIDLRPGDLVLKEGFAETPVKSVRVLEKPIELIEITTDKGSFVAEGVFVTE